MVRVPGTDHWMGVGGRSHTTRPRGYRTRCRSGHARLQGILCVNKSGFFPNKSDLIIPIGERPLDLDLVNQCLDTGKNVPSSQEGLSVLHELCDGVPPISDPLLEYGSDKSDSLRLVEGETPSESFLGERAGLEYGRHPRIQRDWMVNGPDGGRACPVPLGQSSWFEIKLRFDSYLRLRPHDPT